VWSLQILYRFTAILKKSVLSFPLIDRGNCVSIPISNSNCDFVPIFQLYDFTYAISNRSYSLPLDCYVMVTMLNML
jgi:hypothetical protein